MATLLATADFVTSLHYIYTVQNTANMLVL